MQKKYTFPVRHNEANEVLGTQYAQAKEIQQANPRRRPAVNRVVFVQSVALSDVRFCYDLIIGRAAQRVLGFENECCHGDDDDEDEEYAPDLKLKT